jgi:excisionase family DNA binding protein
MDAKYLTPRQVALELGIRLDTVYSLIWAEKLRAEKRDGAWRVSAAAVKERLRERTTAKRIDSRTEAI